MEKRGDRFFPSCHYLGYACSHFQCGANVAAACQPLEMRIPHPGLTRQTPRDSDQMQCHLHRSERVPVDDVYLHTVTLAPCMVGRARGEYSCSKMHTR